LSEIWASLPPKFGGPKTSKFRRDFRQLRDLIANIYGLEQVVVDRGRCKLRSIQKCDEHWS